MSAATTPLTLVPAPTAPDLVPARRSLTLFETEEYLELLKDAEETITPEQEAEFRQDLAAATQDAVAKRDRVNGWLCQQEALVAAATSEIDRLRDRKDFLERALERAKGYVVQTILSLGPDDAGKWRRLQGKTVTFRIQKNPESVEIFDEAAVPSEHKKLTVRIPASLWERTLDSIDMDLRSELLDAVTRPECDVSKTSVKAAIDAGVTVPGVKPAATTYHLRRR